MLVLRRSSRQVDVTDKQLNGTEMISELLGKRQGLTHQTGNALAPRVVETLDVMGVAGSLTDRPVLRSGNHLFVDAILIRVTRGVLTIGPWTLGPQARGPLAAAITHVNCDDWAGLGLHGDPDPLLIGFLRHKARHFMRFDLKALYEPMGLPGDGLDRQRIRQGLQALAPKA